MKEKNTTKQGVRRAEVPPTKPGQESPSYHLELGLRIKAAADRIGTRIEAARAGGISDDQLARIIKGQSQPSFVTVAGIAERARVNLDWLASGVGSMELPSHLDFPPDLLERARNERVHGLADPAVGSSGYLMQAVLDHSLLQKALTRFFEVRLGMSPGDASVKARDFMVVYSILLEDRDVKKVETIAETK